MSEAVQPVESTTPEAAPVTPATPVDLKSVNSLAEYRKAKADGALPVGDATPEQEADGPKTDADVSEAARTLRKNRAEERKAKIQADIDAATRAKHEALRERDAIAAEVQRLQQQRQALTQPQQPQQPQAGAGAPDLKRLMTHPNAPRIEQFDTIEQYNFALSVFVNRTMAAEDRARAEQAMRQQQARTVEQERAQKWNAALEKAAQADPEFLTKLNPETPIDRRIMPYLMDLDDAPAVIAYLSANQQEAQRIATLHPVEQIGQIGIIVGRLHRADAASNTQATASAPVSSATPPIRPVGGSASLPSPATQDAKQIGKTNSLSDYRAWKAANTRR